MIQNIKDKIYSTPAFLDYNPPREAGDNLCIDGLKGSLKAFFLSHLVEIHSKSVVLTTADLDSAEKIRDDIELLLDKKQIGFFPSAERQPYDEQEHNPSLLKLRLETLQQLIGSDKGIIICTHQGIMARVPPPESFIDQQNYIKTKATYNFNHLLKRLHNAGYSRTDIVEDVGHFAVRGGIIDLFPWTSTDPVRIEFFGDQIESIRTFNVISQRSIETIGEIELLPNLDLSQNSASLFDYLPENSLFIIEDRNILEAKVHEYDNIIHTNYQRLIEQGVHPSSPPEQYLQWEELQNHFNRYPYIFMGVFSDKNVTKNQFDSILPPTFAGNLNRLFSYLEKSNETKMSTVIQCGSKMQAERIIEILEDEKLETAASVMVGALHNGFVYPKANIQILTDHEIFDRFKKRRAYQRFKNGEYLRTLSSLNLNDYVVHIEYGIGQYQGLQTIESGGSKRECIKLKYADDDLLFVSVDRLNSVQKYLGEDEAQPKLTRLSSGEWERTKKRTTESIEKIAAELLELQAARKDQKGYAYAEDTHWQRELEASFPFEETEDQLKSIDEVKKDLLAENPMDRLLCGDVGYGKTEVAIRAAFKVVMEGRQVVILVPTTILAYQHFQTFKERMSEFPVNIEMLSRFRTLKEQKNVLEKLASGEIDIIIGTHRVLSEDVSLKNIGLLIIDEEQRFGVKHKEKIKKLKVTVDVLTMSATPIPRTLHMSLMGARDLSHIETPPRNRLPVITEIHEWDDDLIQQAISSEIERKGQVYFVHNRVKSIEGLRQIIKEIVPTARVIVAHGQLPERELEKIMMNFIQKKYDVLISTMIIENGLDIPNVNTIIIDHADKFGLAQLYQLRGRVGRSDIQAYAYLLVPHISRITNLAQKRLKAIQDFTDLGSGFKVALRDMEIRGIGNILGKEQSGNVQAVGFDLYCKLIDETVHKLRQNKGEEETIEALKRYTDAKIDVDFDLKIPESYIANETERISIYHRLVNFQNADELDSIKNELADRFGPVPVEVIRIIDAIELKILAGKIYSSYIRLNKGSLILRFSETYRNEKIFHEKIIPAILNIKNTEVKFTGNQDNPQVEFLLAGQSREEHIINAKNILHNII